MSSSLAVRPERLDVGLAARLREIAASSWLKFALLGLGAYAATLIATLPAGTVLKLSGLGSVAHDTSGTVWNGAAVVGPVTASWRLAPLRSLGALAAAADLDVAGGGSALRGRATWRPGRLVLSEVSGHAPWAVLAAAVPRLPLACDVAIGVELESLVLAGARSSAQGRLTSGAGTCHGPAQASSPLPALLAVATPGPGGSRLMITTLVGQTPVAEASLDPEGVLRASVLPAGSALFPGGAFTGGMTFESRL